MVDTNPIANALRQLSGAASGVDYVEALNSRCPENSTRQLLKQYLDENTREGPVKPAWKVSASGVQITQLDEMARLSLLFAACASILAERPKNIAPPTASFANDFYRRGAAKFLASALFRKQLPYGPGDLELLILASALRTGYQSIPLPGLLNAISAREKKGIPISPGLTDALRSLRNELHTRIGRLGKRDVEDNIAAIDQLLGNGELQAVSLDLHHGEAWSEVAIADLANMNPEQRGKWMQLLVYARTAKGTRPSKKWLTGAAERVTAVGVADFRRHVSEWFSLLQKPRTESFGPPGEMHPDRNLLLEERHTDLLKGLAWACAGLDDAVLARSLGDAAVASYKKIAFVGPRCVKLGNAAVVALSIMPGNEAAAQLGRLSAQVKQASCRKYIDKGMSHIAERTGQTVEDLAELAVPTFGLAPDGALQRELGNFVAKVEIVGSDEAELKWQRADGKPQKGIPADVKRDHADALKELNRAVKDIQKMLPAQRVRVERLLMSGRQWGVADWRSRYADHPLLTKLSRRLIWEFSADGKVQMGVPLDGKIVGQEDQVLELTAQHRVRLWHPIRSAPADVLAWRAWLERHQVTQPFKQAHREVYLLTDAELQTVTYSNRFAAHIVRQHQMAALAQARGWEYRLQGTFDGANSPTLKLPQYQLRVEYWIETLDGSEQSAAGIYVYVVTDQVRFYRLNGGGLMALEEVDPLLFTEIMRDVDLFVGVASVGNDPAWRDHGNERYNEYWGNYSFGDLSESAKTRKAVLERLIPRLKISRQCSIVDKFLIVRGELKTYKIHLGSGNILIDGNDQYLCIVPARNTESAKDVFLPFEGDRTLSIIISKAFLLAADTKIKDPTILRQINR